MTISANDENVKTNNRNDQQLLITKKLIDTEVRNLNDVKLGHLKELVIETSRGEISYGIISYGGLWGMGEHFAAVPYDALRLTNQNQHFVLDVELMSLDSVPSFDNDSWPDMNDSHWVSKIRDYYGSGFAHENNS